MCFKTIFLVCILGLYTHKTKSQYLVSRTSVSLPFDVNKSLYTTISPHYQISGRTRNRRIYAMCPPSFQRVGSDCYSLVDQRSSWLEAHFFCKDKNAKLAEPLKYSDRKLRVFLEQHDMQTGDHDPVWFGVTFDHHNNVWQYSISGRNLSYANFERMDLNRPMDNQCAIYDANNKYRWSSRSCPDKFRFICEHKMPKVSERNRHKVYHRWNATYPNQYANEVVLKVIENNTGKNDRRNHRRVIAEGSTEEILIPKIRIQNARRRQHLHQRQNNQFNDINYELEQKRQKNYLKSSTSTTSAPHDIKPLISLVSDSTKPQTDRQLTSYDRKLQRQREKEQRRQQRKRERQERMRAEKRNRQRQHRQHQQLHHQQTQNFHKPLQTFEENQEQKRQNANINQPPVTERQPPNELNLYQNRNVHENEGHVEEVNKRREEEILQKQHDAETRKAEERRYEKESKEKDERLQKDHEKRLRELQIEHERQLQAEKEFKQRQEEEFRKQLEEQEKQRQENIKKMLEEEEKLKELQRLEEAKIFEDRELERLREENQKREEAQRRREEEIARREAEQKQIEYEEERIRKELEQDEIERNLKHEEEIKLEEETLKAREESEKRERKEIERQREERFNVLKQEADQQVKKELEEKRRNYAERISKLSPEDQKAFIEMRKRRRQLRVKQQSERLKRAHEEISAEALKESSTLGVDHY